MNVVRSAAELFVALFMGVEPLLAFCTPDEIFVKTSHALLPPVVLIPKHALTIILPYLCAHIELVVALLVVQFAFLKVALSSYFSDIKRNINGIR